MSLFRTAPGTSSQECISQAGVRCCDAKLRANFVCINFIGFVQRMQHLKRNFKVSLRGECDIGRPKQMCVKSRLVTACRQVRVDLLPDFL